MINSVTNWLENSFNYYKEKIAISDEKGDITYSEYRNKSLAIAERILESIKNNNYEKSIPIAVYLQKSKEVLISFMGIAYSGSFYCPIDTSMPASRVNKILEIFQPKIIISSGELLPTLRQLDYQGEILLIEEIEDVKDEEYVLQCSKKIIDKDLLYVIFTSGSTGVPKGVSISHGSVINYIDWATETFEITEEDSFGNQAPFFFDNSVLDIFSSMKSGARLFIIPKKLFSQPVYLLDYLKKNKINTIFWVPSALMVVSKLNALKNVDLTGVLKRILFAGEVMPSKQLNVWRKYLPNALYVNLYGPTEITVDCTYYVVDREFADDEPLPIGKPISNTDVLVLNERNLLVSEGEIGELCVRGKSLAMGYYNNIAKTNELFVQNPLNKMVPEIIYRTGDLVKYNSNGELLFLSRKDYQIKHLGHRIELGEIETAVSSIDEVSLCCCIYDERKQKIVLFVDVDVTKDYIKEKIRKLIPDYMMPGKVVYLESIPMNANGKIDRVKLREMI